MCCAFSVPCPGFGHILKFLCAVYLNSRVFYISEASIFLLEIKNLFPNHFHPINDICLIKSL